MMAVDPLPRSSHDTPHQALTCNNYVVMTHPGPSKFTRMGEQHLVELTDCAPAGAVLLLTGRAGWKDSVSFGPFILLGAFFGVLVGALSR